jgi:hypothetical protein
MCLYLRSFFCIQNCCFVRKKNKERWIESSCVLYLTWKNIEVYHVVACKAAFLLCTVTVNYVHVKEPRDTRFRLECTLGTRGSWLAKASRREYTLHSARSGLGLYVSQMSSLWTNHKARFKRDLTQSQSLIRQSTGLKFPTLPQGRIQDFF